MPALLTRIETGPYSLATASMSASTAAPSVTFSTRPTPACAARRSPIASAPASLVAVPMTFAPLAASVAAIAAPMPRLAPVTSAISPCSTAFMDSPAESGFSRRPHQRLRDDDRLAVEGGRGRTVQFVAQRQRLADASAKPLVVRPGQQAITRQIGRGPVRVVLD